MPKHLTESGNQSLSGSLAITGSLSAPTINSDTITVSESISAYQYLGLPENDADSIIQLSIFL